MPEVSRLFKLKRRAWRGNLVTGVRAVPAQQTTDMKLKVGDKAPDFEVIARQGGEDRTIRSRDLLGQKSLVLYFYPKDFTLVCTAEACGFRDMYAELQGEDTELIGVSVDDAASHDGFAKEHGIEFALVSDPRRELARKFGATSLLHDMMGVTARVTYVIDRAGRIAGVFSSEIRARQHLDGVKQALAGMPRGNSVL